MKHVTTVWLIAAALAAQAPPTHPQDRSRPEDVNGLAMRQSSAYVRTFNEHRTNDLGALFAEDADLAFLQGPDVERLDYGLVRGADEMAACFAKFFELYPDARLSQTISAARFIRPDVLIADVDFEIDGLPGDAGPIRGRSIVIRVNESGAWKIAADRNVSRTRAAK